MWKPSATSTQALRQKTNRSHFTYALLLRAKSLLMLSKDAEAAQDFDAALKMSRTLGVTIDYVKAVTYDQIGKPREALAQYRILRQKLETIPGELISRSMASVSGLRLTPLAFRASAPADEWPVAQLPGLDVNPNASQALQAVDKRIQSLEREQP